MQCDLHTHSIHSDGTYTVEQLIAAARELELIIALTDHNTVSGLPEFMEEARRQGVTAVPGIEISTDYGGKEIHLLGLFVEPEQYDRVERTMKEFRVQKEICNMEMVEKLNEAGYEIDYFSVRRRNPEGNANRAHIAAELMDKGYVSSVREAFDTILADDGGFYIQPPRLGLAEAIGFVLELGALPVLAHPLQDLTEEELRACLPILVRAGLEGMETSHSSYDDQTIALAETIASEYGLLPCGGSDFHGEVKPGVLLGVGRGNLSVGEQIYTALLERCRQLRAEKAD